MTDNPDPDVQLTPLPVADRLPDQILIGSNFSQRQGRVTVRKRALVYLMERFASAIEPETFLQMIFAVLTRKDVLEIFADHTLTARKYDDRKSFIDRAVASGDLQGYMRVILHALLERGSVELSGVLRVFDPAIAQVVVLVLEILADLTPTDLDDDLVDLLAAAMAEDPADTVTITTAFA